MSPEFVVVSQPDAPHGAVPDGVAHIEGEDAFVSHVLLRIEGQ